MKYPIKIKTIKTTTSISLILFALSTNSVGGVIYYIGRLDGGSAFLESTLLKDGVDTDNPGK